MARKQIRVSRRMLFTYLMLISLIFFFAPHSLTGRFQFAFANIFRFPLSFGRNVSLSARTQSPTDDVVNRRLYDQLQNHLTNVIQQRDQAYEKVEKLAKLRSIPAWERMGFVLAEIITASDGLQNELMINRGQEDGLAKDQFVIGDNSIIGTITQASARTARVRLFTDPASRIAVQIAGLDSGRLMQGLGGSCANISLVKQKIKAGTEVMACKKPGFLDVPVVMARVAQCSRSKKSPLLWDVTVEPVCDIEELSDVAVIVMNPN